MKSQSAIVPLVDLVFLALGGILACMTQMEIVKALPVEVAEVGKGFSSVVQHEKFKIVSLDAHGLSLDGQPISQDDLAAKVAGSKVILRAHREMRTQETIHVIATLIEAGAEVSIEVDETDATTGGTR